MNILRTLFIFFSLILFLAVPSVNYAAVLLDRVVAVVNTEVITWSELYKMMEYEASEQLRLLKEEERRKVFKENEALFLEKLIDMRLQVQEAKKLGLTVSKEEVTEAIDSIRKKYSLTDESLKESLKKEGLNYDDYRKRIADQIIVGQLVNQQIRNKIVISDEEVKSYMDANREKFADTEAYKIRLIFIRKSKDNPDLKTLEANAGAIIQRLKAGEDFSTLAKEFSEDPSAKIGGDLGYVKKSQMAREFIDILSAIKPGEFSKPFWTDKGLNIIRFDEKTGMQDRNEIMENVKNQLGEEKFLEKYKSWSKGLREKAHIEVRL
jgi:peptidyl-prolyl cis-trans isomerase SurA